jgi:hypothetical protein
MFKRSCICGFANSAKLMIFDIQERFQECHLSNKVTLCRQKKKFKSSENGNITSLVLHHYFQVFVVL